MSIHKTINKVKYFLLRNRAKNLGIITLFIIWGIVAFLLGIIADFPKKEPVSIEYPSLLPLKTACEAPRTPETGKSAQGGSGGQEGAFVASKNGTKYYAKTCGGVSRIKDENKVWFDTEAEAKAAGFERASGC